MLKTCSNHVREHVVNICVCSVSFCVVRQTMITKMIAKMITKMITNMIMKFKFVEIRRLEFQAHPRVVVNSAAIP